MRGLSICGLLMLAAALSLNAETLTVHECLGSHGERVFSDRGACAASALRTLVLDAPEAAPHPVTVSAPAPARRQRVATSTRSRARAQPAEPQSYLCESGSQRWYQHEPCSATVAGTGKSRSKQRVHQSRVSRDLACREVRRPAALLRRGSERDERAGPYARATGRDPCR